MARYVEGYVLPVQTKKLATYRRIARRAGAIWKEHGALGYVEAVGEDLAMKGVTPFPRLAKVKPGEKIRVELEPEAR